MSKKKDMRITIRLEPAVHGKLEDMARTKGLAVAALGRMVLIAYLAEGTEEESA